MNELVLFWQKECQRICVLKFTQQLVLSEFVFVCVVTVQYAVVVVVVVVVVVKLVVVKVILAVMKQLKAVAKTKKKT